MSALDLFCDHCGAANEAQETTCFACGKPLSQTQEEKQESFYDPSSLLKQRYRLLTQVGEGGFAKVYKAEDIQQKKMVAVKIIDLQKLSPQEIIDATDTYNREIHFGTTLRHTSLPIVFDHFMDREHWYIVVEFIDGETLETYARQQPQGRLSLREVLEMGIQVCGVLSYLHTQYPPVIFRDIKPDNIMRTTKGQHYLVDFGIARHFRPGQRYDTQTLGSPGYAAPEQYGTAQTSERSDIYSLAATMKALLTGVNPLDVIPPDIDATIPPAFSAFLQQMLSRDPEQRPLHVQAVKERLQQIAEKEGVLLPGAWTRVLAAGSSLPPPPPFSIYAASSSPRASAKRKSSWMVPVVLSTLLILVIVACSLANNSYRSNYTSYDQAPSIAFSASDQLLTIGVTDLPVDLDFDPTNAYQSDMPVVSMIHAGLTFLDEDMQVQPHLATSWKLEEDGLTWTFTLRPNLAFSDGTALTSEDVAYSLDRALSPSKRDTASQYALRFIKDAEKRMDSASTSLIGTSILTPDPLTVKIITSSTYVFLPAALTNQSAYIVDERTVDLGGNSTVGAGPFRLDRATPRQIDLVPNTYYHGFTPTLKKVVFAAYGYNTLFQTYVDNQMAKVELNSDNYTDVVNVSELHQKPLLWIKYLAMDYKSKPLNNIKIRQALALALDRDAVASSASGGFDKNGGIAKGTIHIIPEGQPGYNPELIGPGGVKSPKGDATLAKKLLQEGMKEEGLKQFPMVHLDSIDNEASRIVEMWQTVLNIEVITGTSTPEAGKSVVKIELSDWIADFPDPQNWTTIHFGTDTPYNLTNYGQTKCQQQVQQLLQKADAMTNRDERIKAYQQAEQTLVNHVAWIPLFQYETRYVVKPELRGYVINTLNQVPPDAWNKIYFN